MADDLSVLIDLNILLDVFQKRQPFYESSANVLAAVETGRIIGFIAAHSLPTLFYLIKKDKGIAEAKSVMTNLLQFIKISPVDQTTIEQALNLDYEDFEDALQMMCAVQGKMTCLITRNVKDFHPALLPVMQPVDFLASL